MWKGGLGREEMKANFIWIFCLVSCMWNLRVLWNRYLKMFRGGWVNEFGI